MIRIAGISNDVPPGFLDHRPLALKPPRFIRSLHGAMRLFMGIADGEGRLAVVHISQRRLEIIREGRYIPDEEVDEWLDGLVGDEPLPFPDGPSQNPRRH